MSQSRQYVFTFNNWRESDLHLLAAGTKFGKGNEILYICFSKEVGESGTPHLQGVIHLKLKVTKESLNKKLFRNACWMQAQRGTKEENVAYITKVKTNEFHESGTALAQGTRTDLDSLGEAIVAGDRPEDIALQNPGAYVRYSKGLHALRAVVVDRPRDRRTAKNVIVHYGPTGTGKTRFAIEAAESAFGVDGYYVKSAGMGDWWDGYDGHKCVVIDEFRSNFLPAVLLGLLDRYQYRVNVKGGSRQFVADTIYITSPTHPDEWYPNAGTDLVKAQIMRRITSIIHMDHPIDS